MVYFVGEWTYENLFVGPIAVREKRQQTYLSRIKKDQKKLKDTKKELAILKELQKRSLPSDVEVARSLYQGWLLELVEHVGLTDPNVNSSEPSSKKGLYYSLSFSVRGRGTLEQLVQFLYEFYRAGHLHKVRSIGISPLSKSGQLNLAISIEALSIPGADRADQLTTLTSKRLVSSDLEAYFPIVERNFFAVGGEIDPTDQFFLSAVNRVNGEPEVWFLSRADDRLIKLRRGETFQVGVFSGTLQEIEEADIVVESEGQRWLLTIGDSLSDAYALPPEF